MPTTNSAYGDGQGNIFCDESTPLKPISKYAIDKVEVENLLMEREKKNEGTKREQYENVEEKTKDTDTDEETEREKDSEQEIDNE